MKVRFFKGIDLSKSHHSCGLKKKKKNNRKKTKNKKNTGTTKSVWVLGKEPCAISAGLRRGPGADQAQGLALRTEALAGSWLGRGVCKPVRRPAEDGPAGPTVERVGSEESRRQERRSGVTSQPVSTPAAPRV